MSGGHNQGQDRYQPTTSCSKMPSGPASLWLPDAAEAFFLVAGGWPCERSGRISMAGCVCDRFPEEGGPYLSLASNLSKNKESSSQTR